MRVLLLLGAMLVLAGCTGSQSISYNADPYQFRPSATLDEGYRSPRGGHKKVHRKANRGKVKKRLVRRNPAAPAATEEPAPASSTAPAQEPSGTPPAPPPAATPTTPPPSSGPTQDPAPTTPPGEQPPATANPPTSPAQ
jgi:hypothetical protein